MKEVSENIETLEATLPKHLDGMAVSPISKLPYKALLYREALIWRMAELARGAFDNFERDNLVSAITLTRAAVETSAALWYLCAKVTAAVKSDAVGDIDDYLMKLVMGSATDIPRTTSNLRDGEMPRPVRIGAFLNAVEKDLEGFSHQYGMLSEYAHPNWHGTGLLYSKHDMKNRITNFGRNIRHADNTKAIGIRNLSVALRMFQRSYHRINDLLPSFTALCESRIQNRQKN
jgi:hypothetical protein